MSRVPLDVLNQVGLALYAARRVLNSPPTRVGLVNFRGPSRVPGNRNKSKGNCGGNTYFSWNNYKKVKYELKLNG